MAVSCEEYWKRLGESGLFTPAELSSLGSTIQAQTAEHVAQELVHLRKLTPFQAKAIYRGQQKSVVLGSYALLDKQGLPGHSRGRNVAPFCAFPRSDLDVSQSSGRWRL